MLSILAFATLAIGTISPDSVPTLWLIGDSTVRNGQGGGDGGQWGWGDCLAAHFDASKLKVVNRAIGGRSSRTFMTEGRWSKILEEMRPGDFVIMQFGHNDGGAINDETRARGSIRGIGDEVEEIENLLTKKHETVHSYGWYMSQYVRDAKAKGATSIVCSLVPRCPQPGAKLEANPALTSYRLWAKQIAEREKADFIDLHGLIWEEYFKLKPEEIKSKYFCETDYTHTNRAGAEFNAQKVVQGVRALSGCSLKNLLKP